MTPPKPSASAPPELIYVDKNSAKGRFLVDAQETRPRLHRYCSRMLGSVLDGEDVVQDTLAAAYFRLDALDPDRPLAPLLFRIAHNRCIDILRRRRFEAPGGVEHLEESTRDRSIGAEEEVVLDEQARRALVTLVVGLPPRQRAVFLLKDLLEHTLGETAEILGCSVGAVKSALHRARRRLVELRESQLDDAQVKDEQVEDGNVKGDARSGRGATGGSGRSLGSKSLTMSADDRAVLERYVDCFNRRDWPALAEVLADDVRLDVVGLVEAGDSELIFERYTTNYTNLEGAWKLVVGEVDGETVVISMYSETGGSADAESSPEGGRKGLEPSWAVRVEVAGGEVTRLRDYVAHRGRVLSDALEIEVAAS